MYRDISPCYFLKQKIKIYNLLDSNKCFNAHFLQQCFTNKGVKNDRNDNKNIIISMTCILQAHPPRLVIKETWFAINDFFVDDSWWSSTVGSFGLLMNVSRFMTQDLRPSLHRSVSCNARTMCLSVSFLLPLEKYKMNRSLYSL